MLRGRVRCLAVVAGFLSAAALPAQNAASPPGAAGQLVVVVDGSKNPEQIPDDLAYRHFLLAVATHEQPTADEQKRQQALLGPVGLADADEKAVALELGKMTTQLQTIQGAMAASDGTPATLAAYKAQEDAAVASAVAQVRQALSAGGLASLNQYITGTVKGNIKVYGLPSN